MRERVGGAIPNARAVLGPRESSAAIRALRSGRLAGGAEEASFESEAARYLGVRGAVAVGSGTEALAVALAALGAGPGKEVVIPAYAPPSILAAVRSCGAEAVFADLHWHDMNISAAQARRRLTHRTAAVVAVHTFGAAAELESLLKLGVALLEEVSGAFGAQDYNRRKLGTFGRAAVASFDEGGLMTTAGRGGMVFSDDRRFLDAARELREGGGPSPEAPCLAGRMTEVQAAVGRGQLRRLPSFLAARRRWADRYRRGLDGLPVELPLQIFGRVYHRFVVKLRRSVTAEVLDHFARRGVEALRPLARPLSSAGPLSIRCPAAERVCRRALALPLFPTLREEEVLRVISALKGVL